MARPQRSTTFAQESTRPITRVALYARVSTLNNQDPEMQLSELREYAAHRGWQIVEEFTDQGVSGCKESRPALNQPMSDACRRRFDAILVWKIDRFGRSLKHLVNALAELAALGVVVIAVGIVLVNDVAAHKGEADDLPKFGAIEGPSDAGIPFVQIKADRADAWLDVIPFTLSSAVPSYYSPSTIEEECIAPPVA